MFYSISITFADGSNPYLKYNMTEKEFNQELKKWEKNYKMVLDTIAFKTIYCYTATEKRKRSK